MRRLLNFWSRFRKPHRPIFEETRSPRTIRLTPARLIGLGVVALALVVGGMLLGQGVGSNLKITNDTNPSTGLRQELIAQTASQPTSQAVQPPNVPLSPAPVVTPTPASTLAATPTPLPTATAGPSPTPVPTPVVPVDSKTLKAQVRPVLDQLWQTYKDRYIQQDGRVKDPQRTDATTSEGQAYAMLRAYWQDDRATFNNALHWSLNNLQLPRGDRLFAYLWGKGSDNAWKVLDRNVATDADQDIAFALLMASRKWNDPSYQDEALHILHDLWNETVVIVKGKPYLAAGDWASNSHRPVLNPSYYAPYAYRLFAQADPDKSHNWSGLVDTTYEVVGACTTGKLDLTNGPGKLPANWCAIDKSTGEYQPASDQDKNLDSDFGYDAFRVLWRLSLDYHWNGEKRALDYLQSLNFLQQEWQTTQKLAVIHDHAGRPKDTNEDLGVYSGAGLGLFTAIASTLADQIVSVKLLPGLQGTGQDDPDPAHTDATKARTYYAQNWVWFGLALYADALSQ